MSNKYCTLIGNNEIKQEYKKINTGFDKVDEDFSSIDERVVNLINNPDGTKDLEIVDARHSTAKGKIFETLDARLEEAEQDHKTHWAESVAKENYQVPTATPLVTFISDDGLARDYSILKPLFESKNAKFTLAIRTNFINTGGVTTAQLHEFIADGHSLVSHTADHLDLTTLTEAEIENQFAQSVQDLKDIVGIDCNAIAYPYGAWNDKVVEIARKHYEAAFATNSEGYNVNKSPIDQYVIARQTLVADGVARDFNKLKEYVDECVKNNGWLVFCIHAFEFNDDATGQANLTALSNLLDYINSIGVPVVNHDVALKVKGNLIDVGNFKKGYFKVSKEGTINSDKLKNIASYVSASTGVNDTTSISNFENGKISITNFLSTDINSFPNGRSGTLYTNKSSSNLELAFQLWYPAGEKRVFYKRAWNTTTNNWDQFYKFVPSELLALNKISKTGLTVDSLLGSFPSVQLTTTSFLNADSSGFPIAGAGTLLTNRLDTYDGFAFQTWIPLNSTNVIARRTWDATNSKWNTWSYYYPSNKLTVTLPFTELAAGAEVTLQYQLEGTYKDKVVTAMPNATMPAGLLWNTYCKANGYLLVRVRNFESTPATPVTSWVVSIVG